ncbi:MAG: hypothetical protein WA708_18995 [Acidobacteriaceae bacterium]
MQPDITGSRKTWKLYQLASSGRSCPFILLNQKNVEETSQTT